MRRLVLTAVSLAALPIAATSALAQADPRLEQLRLTRADMALARQITVRRTDLGEGWRGLSLPLEKPERLACAGFDPDFSRFVITGRAQSVFRHPSGASILSGVEVYASRAHAAGDFRLGTRPGALPCIRQLVARQLAEGNDGSYTARVVSARVLRAPSVGERAVLYRVTAKLSIEGVTVGVYFDLLAFQKGRSIVALLFTGAVKPVAGQAALARAVASRMR